MVMSADRRRLLKRLAFNELRHFCWNNFPANTMAYDIGRYPTMYMEFLCRIKRSYKGQVRYFLESIPNSYT